MNRLLKILVGGRRFSKSVTPCRVFLHEHFKNRVDLQSARVAEKRQNITRHSNPTRRHGVLKVIFVARFKIGHTPRKNRPQGPQPPASSHICCSHALVIISYRYSCGNKMFEFMFIELTSNFLSVSVQILHFKDSMLKYG